jgi:zinc-ribbon domain
MPNFCSSCGAALADRVAFCSACGTPTELGRSSGVKPWREAQHNLVGGPINPTHEESVVVRRRSPVLGTLLVSGVFLLLFAIWSLLPDSPTATSAVRKDQSQQEDSYTPPLQKTFTSMIESFIPRYNGAATEIRKTNVRFERKDAIVRYFAGLGNLRFQGWLGEVHDLRTESDGKASLTIKLKGSETVIGTWNNSFSDSFSDTMISRTNSLYPSLMEIRNGDEVTVSGTFVVEGSGQDYVREMSLTEAGSMTSPEFVVRFSQIGKGSVHTSVAVPRRANDTPPTQVPEMSRPAPAAAQNHDFVVIIDKIDNLAANGNAMYMARGHEADEPTLEFSIVCDDARPDCLPLRLDEGYRLEQEPDCPYKSAGGYGCFRAYHDADNRRALYALSLEKAQ